MRNSVTWDEEDVQLRIIGDVRDVIGFGLAGVPGVVCDSAADVPAALERATHEPGVAVILVSASAARAIAPSAGLNASLPLIVVLPTRSTHRPGTQGGTP